MALAAALDKTIYTEGETITLTVTTAPEDRASFEDVPVVVHVVVGELTADVAGAVRKPSGELLPIVVTDSGARVWFPGADTGTSALFTATA